MNTVERWPFMVNALSALRNLGVEVRSVIDVGVHKETPFLTKVFPDVKHHLIEPSGEFMDEIKENYRGIDFDFLQIALSDREGDAWYVRKTRTNKMVNLIDGVETNQDVKCPMHGSISYHPVTPEDFEDDDLEDLISCKKIRVTALDSILGNLNAASPFLLKIDVDGLELNIVKGAKQSLKSASIVIVETSLTEGASFSLISGSQEVMSYGFKLFDIVDPTYYCGVLFQVDLIFIREDIVDGLSTLRPKTIPFEAQKFRPRKDVVIDDLNSSLNSENLIRQLENKVTMQEKLIRILMENLNPT